MSKNNNLLAALIFLGSLSSADVKADFMPVSCWGLKESGGCNESVLPWLENGEWSVGNSAYYVWPRPHPWNPPGSSETSENGWLQMYNVSTGMSTYAKVLSASGSGIVSWDTPGNANFGHWVWEAQISWWPSFSSPGGIFDIHLEMVDLPDMEDYWYTCFEGPGFPYDCDINE